QRLLRRVLQRTLSGAARRRRAQAPAAPLRGARALELFRAAVATAAHDGVPYPGRIGLRVIDRVVQAAALLAALRAGDDQLGDRGDVAQLGQVAGQQHVPVVLADLLLEERDALPCAREPPVAAHDADVVPHEAADLVPVLGDAHGVGAVRGRPPVPRWPPGAA